MSHVYLLQLVILSTGALIGDLSMVSTDKDPTRSATVTAMNRVITLRIRTEKLRRLRPKEALMRVKAVAEQKDFLTAKHLHAQVITITLCAENCF